MAIFNSKLLVYQRVDRLSDESSSAQREALLAAVQAQGAQLMSLQKAGADGTKRIAIFKYSASSEQQNPG